MIFNIWVPVSSVSAIENEHVAQEMSVLEPKEKSHMLEWVLRGSIIVCEYRNKCSIESAKSRKYSNLNENTLFNTGVSISLRGKRQRNSKMSFLCLQLKDATYADIDEFLDAAELHGKNITTQAASVTYNPALHNTTEPFSRPITALRSPTVSQEARLLKHMFLKLRE